MVLWILQSVVKHTFHVSETLKSKLSNILYSLMVPKRTRILTIWILGGCIPIGVLIDLWLLFNEYKAKKEQKRAETLTDKNK